MGEASKPREHILCLLPLPEDPKILNSLRRKYNVELTYKQTAYGAGGDGALQLSEISDETWLNTTILVTLWALPPSTELAKNLKLIHLITAGTENVSNTPVWNETSIPITNSSGVHGPPISEWVILQILSHSHKEKMMAAWQKKRVWGNYKELGALRDCVGQRLGVLGYGAIGRQVARICKAMGMDVIAYTASPRPTPESRKDGAKYIVPNAGDPDGTIPSAWYSGLDKASLHNFLSQDIDILLISVPLTPQTHHFLSAAEFEILGSKTNAFIINIARGGLINQEDLITYLKKPLSEGGLRGAALDVTEPEPLPEDNELWALDNVAITPHVSWVGTSYWERSFAILGENLENIEKGRGLINVVNRKTGY
ncbi:hypothetical protein DSL72_003032 [Monilinia vaccinii-corymbosi]|uniref:D-isomer specific 2-hydroxyacid dehydrogenase NAD-binding domain-containing protein n=1 Tax=Monilinia vaccinii-corymbosi TaxID=61207 RepID=A0A8A3NYP5_9HELO|nr:hypothetical protein DSL72_003032 [Monilinia vaccinii-corymbosi]